MPVSAELRENDRALYFKFSDPWTIQEMFEAFGRTQQMRDLAFAEHQRPIHSVTDFSETVEPPVGLMRAREAPFFRHPSRGEFMVVGTNPFSRSMVEVMLKMLHYEGALFISTEAEAWARVHQFIANEDAASPMAQTHSS